MSHKNSSFTLVVLGIVGLTAFTPQLGHAALYTTDLTFQTSNQNMWGGAPGTPANFAIPLDSTTVSWNKSGSLDLLGCGFVGCFGAELGGSTSGRFGVEVGGSAGSGAVNVTYPVDVTLTFPDPNTANPGQAFTIGSSFVVNPGSSLTTDFPENQAQLFVKGVFEIHASVSAEGCFFGCLEGSADLVNINERPELFRVNTDPAAAPVSLFGTPLSSIKYGERTDLPAIAGISTFIMLNRPNPDTLGFLDSAGNLTSSGRSSFLDVGLDLDRTFVNVLRSFGIPVPDLQGRFGFSDKLSVDYTLIGSDAFFDFDLAQKFTFDPTLLVSLQFSTLVQPFETVITFETRCVPILGGEICIRVPVLETRPGPPTRTLTFPVGSSVDLVYPRTFDPLQVTPTFTLDNTFTNTTSIPFGPRITVDALSVGPAHVFGETVGRTFGPIFDGEAGTTLANPTVFSTSFALGGFADFTTAPFSVVPTSEPGTLLLLGSGLLLFALKRRRMKRTSSLQ